MPDSETIKILAEFHLFPLKADLILGIVFVLRKLKRAFYAAAFGHLATTMLLYGRFQEAGKMDATFERLAFPFLIFALSFLCGFIGLAAELIVNRRRARRQPA